MEKIFFAQVRFENGEKKKNRHPNSPFLNSNALTYIQRGRRIDGCWVFGGIERLDPCSEDPLQVAKGCKDRKARKGCKHVAGEMFSVIVKNRTKKTLLPLIRKHIAPGTLIISDKWKAYDSIKKMKKTYYKHESVNHSKTFKDPETGACTNLIEGAWQSTYKSKIHVRNYQGYCLGKYLQRRQWLRTNKDKVWDCFWELLAGIDYEAENLSEKRKSVGYTWRSPYKHAKKEGGIAPDKIVSKKRGFAEI